MIRTPALVELGEADALGECTGVVSWPWCHCGGWKLRQGFSAPRIRRVDHDNSHREAESSALKKLL